MGRRLVRFVGMGAALLLAWPTGCGQESSGPSAGALDGDPDDLAIPAFPDGPLPPAADDDWLEDRGFLVSRSRLVLMFQDEATIGEVNRLLGDLDATILSGSPVGGYLVVELPPGDLEQIAAARDSAASSPAVFAASHDFLLEPLALAPAHEGPAGRGKANDWRWDDPEEGGNWGFKYARVPFAWNLLKRIRQNGPPGVAVIDFGFDTNHRDLLFDQDTPDDPRESHGTAVASVVAARFDSDGTEGVVPMTVPMRGWVPPMSRGLIEIAAEIKTLEEIIREQPNLCVINSSIGKANVITNARGSLLRQHSAEDSAHYMEPAGTELAKLLDRLREEVRDDFLVFCAAGNDGTIDDAWLAEHDRNGQGFADVYPASVASPCTNAAAKQGEREQDDRIVVVEALERDPDGRVGVTQRSNPGGDVAAPGVRVGLAAPTAVEASGYTVDDGTSFSSPLVAGLAVLLWAIEPSLTPSQVRNAILDTARRESRVPHVDAYAAVLAIDDVVGEATGGAADAGVLRDLADVDDGTLDGNLRQVNGRDFEEIRTPDGELGDGCVDMADVRAFRDAILVAANLHRTDLDGAVGHPKRDLNADGYLAPRPPASPTVILTSR